MKKILTCAALSVMLFRNEVKNRVIREKFDYTNENADWKNSKDAVQRGMQKLKGGYPADQPYRSSK